MRSARRQHEGVGLEFECDFELHQRGAAEGAVLGRRRRGVLRDGAGLPGVIATAESLETCRDQLAEVVEEWVLVRVSRSLAVPRLGTARVQVRRAS